MQHDPLEFKQFSTFKPKSKKYIIEDDGISSVQFYDNGKMFLAPMTEFRLRGFEDGIRIAVNRDFGEGSAKAYKERKLNTINEMLQKNTSEWIQMESQQNKNTLIKDLEEEIDGLSKTGYQLFKIIDEANENGSELNENVVKEEMEINKKISEKKEVVQLLIEKRWAAGKKFREMENRLNTDKEKVEKYFKGQTNVCKIIFGDDGDGQGKLTSYISFTVGSDGEPYGQKRVGLGRSAYWIHPLEIKNLATAARQYGVSSFSMQFSARRVSKRELEAKKEEIMRKKRIQKEARKRKERAEREARQDEEDFMDSFEEFSFLKNPLRF
tara:strand:+ start:43 stop:1017 length:975 start_codon:yes stop_codon:yes gene_type:complete